MPGGINKVRDLLSLFIGDGVVTNFFEKDFTVGTTAVRILGSNPQRTSVVISNFGAAAVALGFTQAVTATTGILLASNAWVSFSWFPDLDIPVGSFWAISSGAGNAVHVFERLLVGEL